ncbi:MAG: hypothetical protein K5905_10960, partial [Roseibium sp.]|nr:hypothetical protein [Roseibium sp.]
GFKEADSLAIPGHSMIEPLWRGRLETGTMFLMEGAGSVTRQKLCRADLAVDSTLRDFARSFRKHLKLQ